MSKNNNNKGDGGGEKKTTSITVVFKVNMHCNCCTSKIVKTLRAFQGVETVKAESETGKLTVTGDVDPAKLREQLEVKSKKKVELVSPQPNKVKEKDNNKDSKDKNTSKEDKNQEKKSEEKKPKEASVTTAVLKLDLHCQGCIGRIQKTVSKTKGVSGLSIDHEKQLVTVEGTMDVKKLVKSLTENMKRNVEIVTPAKKEKETGDKNKGDGGGKDSSGSKGGEGADTMEHVEARPEDEYAYYPSEPDQTQSALQVFSDDNPNACVVM